MRSLFAILLASSATLFVAGCSSTVGPDNNSPYSVSFHAGAPVNKDYSKNLVETHTDSILIAKGVAGVALRFSAIGRCGCGALTKQFYMFVDSTGRPAYSFADSGSLGVKIIGDEGEAYSHGRVVIDSITKTVTGYTVSFSGRILVGADSVAISNGRMIAPPSSGPIGKL